MDGTLEQARDFFLAGTREYQAGRYEAAQKQFLASLALVPGRVSTLTNLGATQLKLGHFEEAVDVLQEALAQEPDNVEALGHCATACAELGRAQDALGFIERAVARNAMLPAAWTLRGTLLRELGQPAEAAASYRKAVEHGGDREMLEFFLAGLDGGAAPRTAPRAYVQSLFDSYAEGFEDHLVQVLNYHAPEILAAGLARTGRQFGYAIDLGCGTGLAGVALRPMVARLAGVDLSANMVRQARSRGTYDEVVQGDIVEFLAGMRDKCDLVVAADVFIYVGALEPVFERAAAAMKRGGVFCFSVERAAAQDVALRGSLRYAHSRQYIEQLAARNGFTISAIEEHAVRDDQRAPIPGLFAWLVKG